MQPGEAFLELEDMYVLEVDRRALPGSSSWSKAGIASSRGRLCGARARSHVQRSAPIPPLLLHRSKTVFRCHERQCPMVTFA